MADKKSYQSVIIPCRISYPNIAEKGKMDGGTDAYRVQCRIDKSDTATITKIRNAIRDAYVDVIGADQNNWRTAFRAPNFFENHLSADAKDGYPLRDGDMQYGKDEYKGLVFLSAKDAKNKPRVGYVDKERKVRGMYESKEAIEEALYPGCYADVIVDFYAIKGGPRVDKQTGVTNNVESGVGVSLRAVVKTADGERLAGNAPIDFDDMYGDYAFEEQPEGDNPYGNI